MDLQSNGIKFPSNFDERFFSTALRNFLGGDPNFELRAVSFEMGSAPGDNYCSNIYRTHLEYKRKSSSSVEKISFVIKCLLSGKTMDFLEFLNCFRKERIIFTKILPAMQSLIVDSKLAARCYHTEESPTETFVFEDLTALKYALASRENGLDLMHGEHVMKKLAEFHASSLIVTDKNPGVLEHFKEGLLGRNAINDSSCLADIYAGILEAMFPFCKEWGLEHILPKLQKYHSNYKANLIKTGAQRPGEFRVLNHGDPWLTNMMFKYDDVTKEPVDVVFVDLQMSIYSSLGIDLNYFFNTSLSLDVLKNKREHLIEFYYDHFKKSLEKIGYTKIPSYETVRAEVANREDYGFFGAHAIFALASLDKTGCDNAGCDTLADPEASKKQMQRTFSTAKFREHMQYVLRRFDDIGLFEKILN